MWDHTDIFLFHTELWGSSVHQYSNQCFCIKQRADRTLSMLDKSFSRRQFEIFFSPFDISCKLYPNNLHEITAGFLGEIRKNIANALSAKLAQRVVKVKGLWGPFSDVVVQVISTEQGQSALRPLLAHLSMMCSWWAIVINQCTSSIISHAASTILHLLLHPWALVGSIGATCRSKIAKIGLAGHLIATTAAILEIILNFYWTERPIDLKLGRKYWGKL